MNKKLGRLLRPGMGIYIGIMFAFVVAAALVEQYWLAGIELVVCALVLVL